jgi:hypothetical protein
MKKIILSASLVIAASGAIAAPIAISANCAGTATKITINGDATGGSFIKTTFQSPCSQNVITAFGQSSSAAYGSAGSNKGACYQLGHTDAGVKPKTATCSAATGEITGAATPTANDASALGSI